MCLDCTDPMPRTFDYTLKRINAKKRGEKVVTLLYYQLVTFTRLQKSD